MNILFIRVGEEPDTDSRLLKEASSLERNGNKVTVLGWVESNENRIKKRNIRFNGQNIRVMTIGIKQSYRIKYLKAWAFIKFEVFLAFLLMRHGGKYDVIHACNIHTSFVVSLLYKICHVKFVYDIFDYAPDTRKYPKPYKSLVVRMEKYAIEHADCVILCSDERKKQIKGTCPKKVEIIYNSPIGEAELTSFDKPNSRITRKYNIVYIGGLTPYRCLPELLKVVSNSDNLVLSIAGDGIYKEMFDDASKKNDRIRYLGIVPYDKVSQIESTADIMVALYDVKIPNHLYASPNKFFEALRLGKPLVMIKQSGMSEWLLKEHFGELALPTSRSIKAAIDRLIIRSELWPEESERMKKLYNNRFSWNKMEVKLESIYDNLRE